MKTAPTIDPVLPEIVPLDRGPSGLPDWAVPVSDKNEAATDRGVVGDNLSPIQNSTKAQGIPAFNPVFAQHINRNEAVAFGNLIAALQADPTLPEHVMSMPGATLLIEHHQALLAIAGLMRGLVRE